MHRNHLMHMAAGGAALLAVLLVAGVPVTAALPYAAALACPLMMVVMMLSMSRGHGGSARHGADTVSSQHDDRAA